MTDESRQVVDRYWALEMGCASGFPSRTPGVHGTTQEIYPGVQLFLRDEFLIVAAPPDRAAAIAPRIRELPVAEVFTEGFVWRLLAPDVERILGPAHLHYGDRSNLRAVRHDSCRLLTATDDAICREFMAALSADDLDESGIDPTSASAFGAFADGVLCAVASYQVWKPCLAHIGVATHPAHRRRGYGRMVVAALATHALRENLIPQYRALASNGPSLSVARSLGFQRYCSTIYARLTAVR